MRVAVIDLGKTNAKLARVDTATGTEIDVRTMPSPVLDGPPYPHLDTMAIEGFIVAALRDGEPVDAVTVTTHGATAALIDERGELALPVLDYEHDGPDALAVEYDALRAPFEITGSPRLPGGLNIGAQLFWQQRCFPDRFARARTLLTWPQFWVHRLCGIARNDVTSLGCHTDLHEPSSGAPSALVERCGWQSLLPPPCVAGERLATLTDEIARATGLPATTPVHAGIHDSNASLVPHLLGAEGPVTVVSTGTWVIVMAVDGREVELDERRDTLVNVDAFGRPLRSARFMGGREYAILSGREGDSSIRRPAACSQATLERLLAGRVFLWPAVVGGTGPYPDRASSWTMGGEPIDGNAIDTLVGEGAREAVVAGYLAGMTRRCLELAGSDGAVVVEGPFAGNTDYLQALASVLPGELRVSRSRTGTAVGAAMLIERPTSSIETERVTVEPARAALWQRHLAAWADALRGTDRAASASQAR